MYKRDEGWVCEMFDVEAAFLESKVETECYVEWPEGIVDLGFMTQDEADSTCAMLNMAMYGQVDAALLWLRTFGSYLEEDNISLLIKDMDEKEVCRIIPHKHLISLTPRKRRGQWEYVVPEHRYFACKSAVEFLS